MYIYVPSKSMQVLDQEMSLKVRSLEALAALETSQPDQAMAGYEAFLKGEEGFGKPLIYYQNQLKMQLRQMSHSRVQVLGDSVIAAFPYYYHERIRAIVVARLGVSRIRLARGDLAGAEQSARQALDLVNRCSRSRAFAAQETLALTDQLAAVAAKRDARGAGLVIKFDRDMADCYLKSAAATRELTRDAEARERIQGQMREIDKFIEKVNSRRSQEAVVEFLGNLGDLSGGVGFTPDVARVAGAVAKVSGAAGAAVAAIPKTPAQEPLEEFIEQLDPAQYPTPVVQLLDPQQRPQVHRLLKNLTAAASRISDSMELEKKSQAMATAAEAVEAAGGSQDLARLQETAEKFMADFSSLRTLVATPHPQMFL